MLMPAFFHGFRNHFAALKGGNNKAVQGVRYRTNLIPSHFLFIHYGLYRF